MPNALVMMAPAAGAAARSSADELARKQGFPDAATMQAFMNHRSEALRQGSNTVVQPGDNGNEGSILNPFQGGRYEGPLSGIFHYITRAMGGQ